MNNIVFDLILLEADREINQKVKGLDLYYKNQKGEFVQIAEGYNSQADEVIANLLRRKKMRYMITFTESLSIMNEIKPSSNKILRLMCQQMNYGNLIKN
jgi:hypothetical protein